jgi:hypothetical protein
MGKTEIGDFMPRLIRRLFLLSIACMGCAFGQTVTGTFAQIVYGGTWQTTFTLINLDSTNLAGVTLTFFGDNGAPLNVPVVGFGSTSSYTFTIPASGSQNIVLSSGDPLTEGWATMSVTSGTVRGQGSFRSVTLSGATFETVVPLSTSGSAVCIIPFPPPSNPVILIPFDNTGGHNTSIALANTTNVALTVPIEFDDQTNRQLKTDSIVLQPMAHTAFTLASTYQVLAGTKGVIRIQASTSSLTVLGLLSNANNAITTIIPITQ